MSQAVALPPPVHVLGIPVHPISAEQLVETIIAWGKEPGLRRVYHVNVHAMNFAHDLPEYRKYLQSADLVFCDGYGVKLGARIVNVDIPYRTSALDWVDDFASATAAANQSVFALGEVDGIADKFQRMLAERHPGYRNAGSHHGFFEKEGPENDRLVNMINSSGATHLLVGFGMPLQERWIEANAPKLRVRVAIAFGGTYKVRTGDYWRAPRWITDNGLEWAVRLAKNPIQHFRRYVIGNPRFVGRLIKSRLRDGVGRN